MSRKPRFVLPGVPQHIVQRGHNRGACFFNEFHYKYYIDMVRSSAEHNDCAVHAYCLMTNHVHLLVTPFTEFGLSHFMQDIGRKFVRYVNRASERRGTLWEGRYRANLVDSEAYLLTCMRYIELNPVRAGMVQHAGEYPWSSYASNAYGKDSGLIQPHPTFLNLHAEDGARQAIYRELFSNRMDEYILSSIREALNQELVLGRDDFKEYVAKLVQRQVRPGKPGRPAIRESGRPYLYYVI